MPTCSLWQRWCCRCKVCANWLIINLKNQISACVGKEGIWRKRSKLSHWIVQSCASQPTHDWSCFLVPWYKSIVNSADAKWHYFLLTLVQIRGKVLAFIPGGSDLVFQSLKLPTSAIWGCLWEPLAVGSWFAFSAMCFAYSDYDRKQISNFLLWGTGNLGRKWNIHVKAAVCGWALALEQVDRVLFNPPCMLLSLDTFLRLANESCLLSQHPY